MHVSFKVEVQLYDGGTPPKRSERTAVLTVDVIRNKNAPQFINSTYKAVIRKDLGFGNSVAKVFAVDADPEVCFY